MILPIGPPQTNVVPANGIVWYGIVVPTNAIYATNTLVFATAPVNLWFSTNQPPSTTGATDVKLLNSSLAGASVIGTTTTPALVPL